MRKSYAELKEQARNKAIEWQYGVSEHNYSQGEFAYFGDYFLRQAKRYGLIKEFKQNGII